MKVIRCTQGSAAWLRARCGKPTSSMWDRIISPKQRKVRTGATPRSYMRDLVIERLTGESIDGWSTKSSDRGTELEPHAAAWYEMRAGVDLQHVGFCMADHARWGCSPDGLVGDDGGFEAKCYELRHHFDATEGDYEHDDEIVQVQACLWITGRAWWDLVHYTDVPALRPRVVRIEPDPAMHAVFEQALPAFCDELDAWERRRIEAGDGDEARALYALADDARRADWFAWFEAQGDALTEAQS